MTNDNLAAKDQSQVRFYDNYTPTLEAGDYLINVTQQINPRQTTINECYAAAQVFSVQAPRYALPVEDIYSVFPPNNAQGMFDQFLPHVVLTKRDLPWEQNIFDDQDQTRQAPWMALLLFVEGEKVAGQDALLPPQSAPGKPNQTMTTVIPAYDFYHHAAGDGVLWPALQAEWYESDDYLKNTLCSVVDISPAAFTSLLPRPADLPYLAHVRQVNQAAKESDALKLGNDGWYSIIVGNRLPAPSSAGAGQPGQRNIAHLVSLEGFQDHLGKDLPAGTTRVRMVSFASWTFNCLSELGESFSELMNGLLRDQQGEEKSTTFTLPVAPPADTSADADYTYRVIQNGYVPLRYQTRPGEQTFAWYRGPFAPVPVKNFISTLQQTPDGGWQPFDTASSALIYDKDYGLFNVSYAVAWETGRLLALSNGHFWQELLDWQQKGHRLLDLVLERKSQLAALKNFSPARLALSAGHDLLKQIESHAIADDFVKNLSQWLPRQLAPTHGVRLTATSGPSGPSFHDLPAPPTDPQTIASLSRETDVQEALRKLGAQELDSVVDYLADLYLLAGVPFECLVPHTDLLPAEAVRFFYLDSNWLDSLVEGALSIGIESSRDRHYQDLMKDLIWKQTHTAVQQARDDLLGSLAHTNPAGGSVPFDQEALTGMLLRSAVVSGWPGLEINAYIKTKPDSAAPDLSSRMKPLRLERLSDDVLLCLWPAVPAVVTINEPHEGLAFGFEDPPHGEGYYLYLRSLDPSRYGMPLCTDEDIEKGACQFLIDAVASKVIDPGSRLVKITGGGGLLESLSGKLPGAPVLRSRDFAVQMIKTPEQAVFATEPLKENP